MTETARLSGVHPGYSPKAMMTAEGGLAVRLVNKTGAASVKGTLAEASSAQDSAFGVADAEYDTIGAVYENGIADGALCWVVIGGIAEVLLEDATAATRHNWVHSATTDGRADASLAEPSGGGFNNANEHFKEIGHCLESVAAGTDKLCKILMHLL